MTPSLPLFLLSLVSLSVGFTAFAIGLTQLGQRDDAWWVATALGLCLIIAPAFSVTA